MKILFLCTSNIHRSKTAEDYFRTEHYNHEYKSAGLSEKYCEKYGSTLCTFELLDWADKVFAMETMHFERIYQYAGKKFLSKIEVLDIEDIYQYNQAELINKLKTNDKLSFLVG